MARHLQLNEDFAIYRSRHTGAIGFWQRNTAYDYYAALEYLPEGASLTVTKLDEWSVRAGLTVAEGREKYLAVLRKGGNGMRPVPDYKLPN